MIIDFENIGNILLAYICNDLSDVDKYKVEGSKCYYEDRYIGEANFKNGENGVDVQFTPSQPIHSLVFNGFVLNRDIV